MDGKKYGCDFDEAQCKGCFYWRNVGSADTMRACHHLLYTGERRKHDGAKCLSRVQKKFLMPAKKKDVKTA